MKAIESVRDTQIAAASKDETGLTGQALSMIAQLVMLTGIGATTASVLVTEVFARSFRDRRALARFVGLAPVRWYRERVEKANGAGKKTFIVALRAQAAHRVWRFARKAYG